MTIDTIRAVMTYLIAILILVGGFYALVIYPFVLDDLVAGAIISFMTLAVKFVFDGEQAKAISNALTKAYLMPAPGQAEQTTTVSAGPPVTITTENNP